MKFRRITLKRCLVFGIIFSWDNDPTGLCIALGRYELILGWRPRNER